MIMMSLTGTSKEHGFDGAVLEIWSQLGGRFTRYTALSQYLVASMIEQSPLQYLFHGACFSELIQFLKTVAEHFHSENMHLILVIPSSKEG